MITLLINNGSIGHLPYYQGRRLQEIDGNLAEICTPGAIIVDKNLVIKDTFIGPNVTVGRDTNGEVIRKDT